MVDPSNPRRVPSRSSSTDERSQTNMLPRLTTGSTSPPATTAYCNQTNAISTSTSIVPFPTLSVIDWCRPVPGVSRPLLYLSCYPPSCFLLLPALLTAQVYFYPHAARSFCVLPAPTLLLSAYPQSTQHEVNASQRCRHLLCAFAFHRQQIDRTEKFLSNTVSLAFFDHLAV